jgi:NAD(P)-dependent dehydrogenase (short-subunit alcohol dehydrogenase family)
MRLENKVAIVTGGRRGMGKAHALALAKQGAKVVVSDLSLEDCQKVVEEIKNQGGEGLAVKCDVSQKHEVEAMVKKTIDQWGKIDVLVNNAGIVEFVPFLEMKEENWDRMMAINLKGYFLCAQACAKQMVKQKSGSIINVASVAMGQQGIGFPNIVHYCASKGGIAAMTEALALELAPYQIRVNTIAPGLIDTPMIQGIKNDPQSMNALLQRIPMHRPGKPEEVSNLVVFLASDESSYMTGSTIVIDGGWLAG